MEDIVLQDIFLLPVETQCQILSNIKDVRTLQRIIVSTNDQGVNPLYNIAKDCVTEINKGLHIIEYESDDGSETIRSDDSVVHVPILFAYPNVYKVRSNDENITTIDVDGISDVFFLSIHPSIQIAMIKFHFEEEDGYIMIKEFIYNYLYGYNIINGKRKNITLNNFKDKYLMLYLNDDNYKRNFYIFICNDSLVINHPSNHNTLEILHIINVLLTNGNFKTVYLSLSWDKIRDNTYSGFNYETAVEEFYENLNSLENPVNIVINRMGINIGYLVGNIDKVHIITDEDENVTKVLSDTFNIDDMGGFDELSGPFDVDDMITVFTFEDKNNSIIRNPISLGIILYSKDNQEREEIYKIMNSKMHRNVKTITMYVNDTSLFGQIVERNGRTFIFKPHVNIDFHRNNIFNSNTNGL